MTVLPGYVFTKMTKSMKLPNFLTAKPDGLATYLIKAKREKYYYYLPIENNNFDNKVYLEIILKNLNFKLKL